MLELSAAAAQVLRSSHQIDRRVTAYSDTQAQLVIEPVADGSVSCDLKSSVRRTARLSIADPDLWPTSPSDPLSEVASEIGIEYGVVIPRQGTEWLQVFRGPIQTVTGTLIRVAPRTWVSGLEVSASARAQRAIDNRLPAPIKTVAGPAVAEITRLIRIADPAAVVVDATGGDTATVASIEVDKDLWADGVQKLAAAAGMAVDTDPSGAYRIKHVPTVDDPPVWRIDAGGVLVSADLERTRAGVYNGVQVSNARADSAGANTPTVTVLVTDDDPASPTFWGGRFGKKIRYYTNPAIQNPAQAVVAGKALLAKARGISCTVALTAVPNPALEEGDVIEVDLGDGRLQRHVLDSFTIDLKPAVQALTTRAVELPAEQASGV